MSSEGIYCAVTQDGGKHDKGLSGLIGTRASSFFLPGKKLFFGKATSAVCCDATQSRGQLCCLGEWEQSGSAAEVCCCPPPSACSQHSTELQQTPCSRKASQQIPRLTAALKDNKKTKIFQSITTLCLSFQWLWGTVYLFFKLV